MIRGIAVAGVSVVACLACSAGAGAAQISGGGGHTCLLESSGHVYCWGENEGGELGNGTMTNSDVPVEAQGITDAVQVSAGEEGSCAVLSSGHVDCWGSDFFGALGHGTRGLNSDVPLEVQDLTDAVQVAVGHGHSCALRANGHVDCWGGEDIEHIVFERETPVEVPGIQNATQIAAGGGHSCALLSDGHVECWEENENGQLGVDPHAIRASETPVEVTGLAGAIQIAVGSEHSCALLSGGHVSCWGDNEDHQLGDGTTQESYLPVEVLGVANATQLAASAADSCAVSSSGHVTCWGSNYYGQLGDGTIASASTPVEVHGITNAVEVAAGGEQSCGLLSDATVVCWGNNEADQLGDGANGGDMAAPITVPVLAGVNQVAVAFSHSCAALSSGHVDCWGNNEEGQLGDGSTQRAEAPSEVHGLLDAVQVASGEGDSCAVRSNGRVDCWGGDSFETGELGDGAYESSATPVEVKGLTDATQVATSTYGSCARLSDGHVDCWGTNEEGELGGGTRGGSSDTPVEVKGLTDATQVAAGEHHFCALRATGQVACWGSGIAGRLGDGGEAGADTPVPVHGLTGAVRVAAAYENSCATLSDGHVDCWGANYNGQLGDGTTTGPEYCAEVGGSCSKTPVEVHGITSATAITISGSDACAVLSSGHAECWGGDLSGQLGNGTAAGSDGCTYYACNYWDTPVEVQGLINATGIAAGVNNWFAALGSACAVLASQQVDCWGSNHGGALGDDLAWSTSPVGVAGLAPQPPGQSPPATETVTPRALEPSGPSGSAGGTVRSLPLITAGAPSAASLRRLSATVSRRGKLSLRLSCSPGASTCDGTVSVVVIDRAGRHRGRAVVLASARYTIRAGSITTITLTLSSYARALLAERNTVYATAIIAGAGGGKATRHVSRLTIHAARH